MRGRNCPVHLSPGSLPLPHTMPFCPCGSHPSGAWPELGGGRCPELGSQRLPLLCRVGLPGRLGVSSRAGGPWKASALLSPRLGGAEGSCLCRQWARAWGSGGGHRGASESIGASERAQGGDWRGGGAMELQLRSIAKFTAQAQGKRVT